MDLEVQALSCGYSIVPIVNNFSAEVKSGEVFCLLGPNGIGKTTLFKTVLGLMPPLSGAVKVGGRDIKNFGQAKKAKLMGYVPQTQFSPFAYSVFEVVLMGRTSHLGLIGQPGPKDYQIVTEVIERLGLENLTQRAITELSGGERQMVMIARALAQDPAFLLMDEPTSNLDFGNQVKVLKTIRNLASQGLGIFMTTHFPDHVFLCGSQVALMARDRPALIGSVAEVMTSENLSLTYGVEVDVVDISVRAHVVKVCRPRSME
ncbi:MAG: ABC transporter ATP-binding protein [Deltaproteobacteria bacterium]|jgi:iron complex transport system ATP-binding protein|nr:ABC transporter ATP-binding protein [Deltaproteobacteria bacterium]